VLLYSHRQLPLIYSLRQFPMPQFLPIPPINIPTVPFQPNKDFLAKLKPYTDNNKKSYAQASKLNMEDIIHIKDIFSSLPLKKIIEVNDLLSKLKLIKP